MKRIYTLSIIVLLMGCNSPDRFAEKVISEIGDGKYRNENYKPSTLFLYNKEIFDEAEVNNACRNVGLSKKIVTDFFFNTDFFFDSPILIKRDQVNKDIYSFTEIRKDETAQMKQFFRDWASVWKDRQDLIYNDSVFSYLEHENVPIYIYSYKISVGQAYHIATLDVAKIPNKGLRVTKFIIENQ